MGVGRKGKAVLRDVHVYTAQTSPIPVEKRRKLFKILLLQRWVKGRTALSIRKFVNALRYIPLRGVIHVNWIIYGVVSNPRPYVIYVIVRKSSRSSCTTGCCPVFYKLQNFLT